MAWFHIYVIAYLVIACIGVLLSRSCSGLIGGGLMVAGLIWALNAGNFFA